MGIFQSAWRTILGAVLLSAAAPAAMAQSLPDYDPFYGYDGVEKGPLANLPLGTVIKQRISTYYFNDSPTPYTLIQVLYRTSNALNQPAVNVASLIKGLSPNGKAVVDGLAYDSTNPLSSPSVKLFLSLDIRLNPGLLDDGIQKILGTLNTVRYLEPFKELADEGYTVVIPDTEGETADFAAGAEEGMTTLDAVRAALNVPESGLTADSKVAMIGYSGGAIAVDWAAQLAPTYAPDVNRNLVGAAFGGLLISPINNILYINRQSASGVAPLALTGMARAYAIDQDPYLNATGQAVYKHVYNDGIADAVMTYLFRDVFSWLQPQYQQVVNDYIDHRASLSGVPAIKDLVNNTNVALQPTPTIPIYFTQGSRGITLGNFTGEPGDGLMLADDARSLVQQFCKSNSKVQYNEPTNNHIVAAQVWKTGALPWIRDRFAGVPAPGNCAWAKTLPGSYIGWTN